MMKGGGGVLSDKIFAVKHKVMEVLQYRVVFEVWSRNLSRN